MIPWTRRDGSREPVVRIAGGRSTIYVGQTDLQQLAHAVVDALREQERIDTDAAQQQDGEAA